MDEPKRLSEDGAAPEDLQLYPGIRSFKHGNMAGAGFPIAIQFLLKPRPEGKAF